MGKLVYFKWMIEDANILKENLSTEQVGELFLAVMDYLQTGIVKEVPKEIQFPYAAYRCKVDRASANYNEICAKRANNGKKGGIAKATSAAAARIDNEKKFKPPTLTQFKNAVRHMEDIDAISNEYDDTVKEYDIEAFYSYLSENGWKIGTVPIQSRDDWESAIIAKFDSGVYIDDERDDTKNIYREFSYVFAKYNAARDESGNTRAIDIACSFWKTFDLDTEKFFIDKQKFSEREWEAALNAYILSKEPDLANLANASKASKSS